MPKCVCSDEWILSYDVREVYLRGFVLPHSDVCEMTFIKEIRESRDMQILERWKWITATERCDYPYSHSPHGKCTGRSFDRT